MEPGTESRAWKLVAPHCDIEDRVRLVPDWAKLRGLYLVSVLKVLERAMRLDAYREYFPAENWASLPYYPVSDFLLRLAVAGAVLATPETVHLGMHRAMRQNALGFTSSLIGRVLLRGLARDPLRLAEQGMAARRLSTNYGNWTIRSHGPRFAEIYHQSEYVWLDSAVAGSAVGTFEACGIEAEVQMTLIDRFNAYTRVTW